jgi:hypothetical protein
MAPALRLHVVVAGGTMSTGSFLARHGSVVACRPEKLTLRSSRQSWAADIQGDSMSIDTDALMRFGAQHRGMTMPKHQILTTAFAKVYPLYVQKAERKSRTKEEVDQIICWLTGYDTAGLHRQIEQGNDFQTFFAQAPSSMSSTRTPQTTPLMSELFG